LQSEVELTDEREAHIAHTHPDLLPEYLAQVGQTLTDPDQVRRSHPHERSPAVLSLV